MSPAGSLHRLAADAANCTRCALYARATQTVFGVGSPSARLMLVGEQPGDQEDRQGTPFVGPAGRVLDRALDAADIERDEIFLTNAVKHFKWRPSGKRRIHERPNRTEIVACHVWLEGEIDAVDPTVVVALGATAGQALWGSAFRLGASRGIDLDYEGRAAVATIHPSAVLRAKGAGERDEMLAGLITDLSRARAIALGLSAGDRRDVSRSSKPG